MDILTYGLLAFLVFMVGGRVISERALRKLPGEQKLLLLDAFSSGRMYGLVIGVLVVASVILLPKLFPSDTRIGLYIGIALFTGWVVVRQLMTARRLRSLEVDQGYKRSVMLAQVFVSIGMVILIACVVFATRSFGTTGQ